MRLAGLYPIVNKAFFNSDGKLRSGWRVVLFASLYVMCVIVMTSVAFAVGLRPGSSDRLAILVGAVTMLVPAVAAGLLCTLVLERLGMREFGVALEVRSVSSFGLGFAVGIATLAVAVIPALVAGGLRFQFNSIDTASLLGAFAVMAVAAAAEEALFRGYILQTLAREGYAWLAIALTAVFFGLGHARNPGASATSTAVTVLAGIWFGVAYLRTRDLWFVSGMHLAWNWLQGSILGIEVSGLLSLSGTPLLKEVDLGPEWLTGGSYGIEGSLPALIAILISAIGIYFIRSGKRVSGDLDLEADIDRARRVGEFAD